MASVAAAALLAGPAIANAQGSPDRHQGGAGAQGTEQQAPKAGQSNPSEHRQTTGQSLQMNDRASKSGAEDSPRAQGGKQDSGKQDKTNAAQKSGGSEMNRTTTGASPSGQSGSQSEDRSESRKSGSSFKGAQQDNRPGTQKSGKSDLNRSTTGASQGNEGMDSRDQKPGAQRKGRAQDNSATQDNQRSTTGQSQTDQRMKGDRANTGAAPGAQGQTRTDSNSRSSTTNQNNQTSTTQGSTNTGAVTQEKQTKFNAVIEKQRIQPVTNANFSVSVGTSIPRSVQLHQVPRDIVTVYPEYRGKEFVVVHDEIVIVEPGTRKIVTVIPRSGRATTGTSTSRTSTSSSSRLQLAPEKRRLIRETVIKERSAPRCSDLEMSVGAEVPRSLQLRPLPDLIVQDVPAIRSYEFCVKDDDVVLVDPSDYRIVEVIQ